MLKISERHHNHQSSGVSMLAKFIRLGFSVIVFLVFVLSSTACQGDQTPFPGTEQVTAPATEQPTGSKTITALDDATPTTSMPSDTPIPSAIATSIPTETHLPTLTPPASENEVWVIFQNFGDAGKIMPKDYMGDFLPIMVLYTDGQLIRNGKDGLTAKQLSSSERCKFLKELVQTGIFEIDATGELESKDPIYNDLDPDLSYIDDSQGYSIVINGNPSKKVLIKVPAIDYLIPQAKALLDLVDQFQPEAMQAYAATQYLLYITSNKDVANWYLNNPQPQNWPKGMLKLKDLIGKNRDVELVLTQEQEDILLPYFDRMPGMQIFTQNENEYAVVLRPLLPGETTDLTRPFYPFDVVESSLPFECEP